MRKDMETKHEDLENRLGQVFSHNMTIVHEWHKLTVELDKLQLKGKTIPLRDFWQAYENIEKLACENYTNQKWATQSVDKE